MTIARSSPARASALARFMADRQGAAIVVIAVLFAAMMGLLGLGLDYWQGLAIKRRLDAAADAAAIAAVTGAQNSIKLHSATEQDPGLTNNAVMAGKALAAAAFPANAGSAVSITGAVAQVQLIPTAQTFTATISYTATMPTAFGGMFGTKTMNVKGIAVSSVSTGMYLNFYLVLDVPGSLGIPTTADGQKDLMRFNDDDSADYLSDCQFACHFSGYKGYSIARTKGITPRIDSVANAVTNLINTAQNTRTYANQYRIGLYPFIVHAMEAAKLSSDFTNARTVTNGLADGYLDQGLSNPLTTAMGSGSTHFDNVMLDILNIANDNHYPFGDGSSAQSPKPFLFIGTDGANNDQVYSTGGNWTGSQPGRPTDFTYCAQAQAMKVTVSVLYSPYVKIQNPNPNFAENEDGKINDMIDKIPADLAACASPGFFFTANSDTDINNVMQTMFAQSLKAARSTQ